MDFKLIKFDKLLHELKHKQPLEENLSKIIRDIESEFSFQSLGVFLKAPKSDIFRLKISRNISYTYGKKTTFSSHDKFIQELSKFEMIQYKSPKQFKFEKDFTHLLILPLYYKENLLGFLFIDKMDSTFTDPDISKIRMFASIITLVIKIFRQQHEIELLTEMDEILQIYSYKTFLGKADYLLSHVKRYKRDLTMIVLKIANFHESIRIDGIDKTNEQLKQITEMLKRKLRDTDIIGRIYRDRIAILMPETSLDSTINAVERLNTELQDINLHGKLKVAWGIASNNESIKNIEELLRFAEEAAFESTRKTEKITVYKYE
ncbi:MAG TPA: diguanylate cyclase [Candidatus Cloacimonetes bacterium]|nr:diguanylate cyclase [Candidatus Cloacimonadota bacterium]